MKQLAVALVLLPLAATAAYVQYTICPESLYDCAGSSCRTIDLPEGQCQASGNSSMHDSQWLECMPYAGLCAAVDYYSSAACTGRPEFKNDLVCGECYKHSDGSGYVTPKCFYTNDGVPMLNVTQCRDDKCQDCDAADSVIANSCLDNQATLAKVASKTQNVVRNNNGAASLTGSSSKFVGFRPCEFLFREMWLTPDCSGNRYSKDIVPARTCINGVRLGCVSDRT